MTKLWQWMLTKFWWFWSINCLLALLVVGAFILGWEHETITAPNIPAWCVIVSIMPAILLASLWLRSRRPTAALVALVMIPLPLLLWGVASFLFGILYLLIGIISQIFGHGRVN